MRSSSKEEAAQDARSLDSLADFASREKLEREQLVAEARSWLGTPYHHMGRVKGAGADCLTFIADSFAAVGFIPRLPIPHYPPDWHFHRDDERYLEGVLQYCVALEDAPLPGDLMLWRVGRCFSHGAIVAAWPLIIHAEMRAGRVLEEDADRTAWLNVIGERTADRGKGRPRKLFRLKRWCVAQASPGRPAPALCAEPSGAARNASQPGRRGEPSCAASDESR